MRATLPGFIGRCRAASVWLASIAVAAGVASCGHDLSPTGPTAVQPASPSVQDATHNAGNPHFYWLPPLVKNSAWSGTFDGSQSPVVTVCEWTGSDCVTPVLAAFTTETGPGSETVRVDMSDSLYIVDFHTDQFTLDQGATYRIEAQVGGLVLAHADLELFPNQGAAKNTDTGDEITLVDGKTLPIKFRIEEGALEYVGPDGGTITLADGAVRLLVKRRALRTVVRMRARKVVVKKRVRRVGGTGYDLEPDGLTFDIPADLTIRYDGDSVPSGADPASLALLTGPSGGGGPFAGVPSTADPTAREVTASISHFSSWVVGPPVSSVQLDHGGSPLTGGLTLAPGDTAHLSAVLTAGGGTASDRVVTWASSDPDVATVDASGVVTAVAEGSATVTATSGTANGSTTLTVTTASSGPTVTLQDLGSLVAGYDATGRDVNAAGDVVGEAGTASGRHAFLWTEAGGLQDLGTLGGSSSIAYGINGDGVVVGVSATSTTYPFGNRAFRWTSSSGMQDLGVSSGWTETSASSVNASGEIVGLLTGDSPAQAFVWTPGTGMTPIGAIGTAGGEDLNDAGTVAGTFSQLQPDGLSELRAAIWTSSGGLQSLGTLGGGEYDQTRSVAVNDVGQVLGTDDDVGPFVWSSGAGFTPVLDWHFQPADLNDQADMVGANSGEPVFVTSDGHVVALPTLGTGGEGPAGIVTAVSDETSGVVYATGASEGHVVRWTIVLHP